MSDEEYMLYLSEANNTLQAKGKTMAFSAHARRIGVCNFNTLFVVTFDNTATGLSGLMRVFNNLDRAHEWKEETEKLAHITNVAVKRADVDDFCEG